VDILVGIPAVEGKYFGPALGIPGYIGILLAQDTLEVAHIGFVTQQQEVALVDMRDIVAGDHTKELGREH
jgi:hypothetical protein